MCTWAAPALLLPFLDSFITMMARPLIVNDEFNGGPRSSNGSSSSRSSSNQRSSNSSSGSSSPDSPRSLARRSQLLWMVALAGVAWLVKRSQQETRPALLNPPYCAWRFVGNHDAWNVAFPDMRSLYHVMQMQMNEGDEFKLVAESFPYARYASYQTYDLNTLMSHQSLRDVDIIPDSKGPNCYANLTAAQLGEKQGGYTIYITGHGEQNYTNELRALPNGVSSGQFDIFFRIYVEEALQGPHQAPWGHLPPYGKELAFEWGWAPPPRVYIKRAHLHDGKTWEELPFCQYRRRKGFKLLAYLSEIWPAPPPPFAGHPSVAPNRANNFFLPKYADREGKFASKDANYVGSVCEPRNTNILTQNESSTAPPFLWARVEGRLPRVPGSLYTPPYVANASDYDVRYVSLSAVHRTIPFRNHATVADTQIINHYRRRLALKEGEEWDGKYVIWVVPPETEIGIDTPYPKEVREEGGVIMKWGASLFGGRTVEYPGLLYRQVMAQSQVLGLEGGGRREEGREEGHVLRPSAGVVDIVPEKCEMGQVGPRREGEEGREEEEVVMRGGEYRGMEKFCCSKEAAVECFMPGYVQHRMGRFYPQVTYYKGRPEDEFLRKIEH